jgi:tetratricopeptide (TPR) repeat protein
MVGRQAEAVGERRGSTIVGRESERAAVERFLDADGGGLGALLISGPAGIGKTTVWGSAVGAARARGARVVSSRPTGGEARLSFAGLVDLFAEIADEHAATLPEPQRRAVDAALFRAAESEPPSPLGVSLGILGLLRAASRDAPLIVAVDDVQWLDEPSLAVLEFAIRRLDASNIRLVVAERTDGPLVTARALVADLPANAVSEIAVAPLSVDEIASLVPHALGLEIRRSTARRLHELSGGNAFYTLELARAMADGHGGVDPDVTAIPATLDALVRDRLARLPEDSASVALRAAAMSAPSVTLLERALGRDVAQAGIAGASDAGVLVVEGDAVRFTHPLLAAAIHERAPIHERRLVHAELAAISEDLEQQARHLALAATGPDPAVADALERAAAAARARGAAIAAADLSHQAVDLTPVALDVDRRRRMLAEAEDYLASGDTPGARRTLDAVLAESSGDDRAVALERLAIVLMYIGERLEARERLIEALALVPERSELRVRIDRGLAGIAFLTWRDWEDGARHIEHALLVAEEVGDPRLVYETIGHYASWQFVLGHGVRRDLMARAAALPVERGKIAAVELPEHQFAKILALVGEFDEARAIQERLIADARSAGDWTSLPWLHEASAWLELDAGRWTDSEQHLDETRAAAAQSGQPAAVAYSTTVEASLLALRGAEVECRAASARALAQADAMTLATEPWKIVAELAILD